MKTKRKITVVEGPLFQKNVRDCQLHLIRIAKENIEKGKYQPNKKSAI